VRNACGSFNGIAPKSARARADQTFAASRSAGCDETIFVAARQNPETHGGYRLAGINGV
jgi:hypothetical protein